MKYFFDFHLKSNIFEIYKITFQRAAKRWDLYVVLFATFIYCELSRNICNILRYLKMLKMSHHISDMSRYLKD